MSDIWQDLTDAFNKDMAIDEMQKKYGNTYLMVVPSDGRELLCLYKGWNNGFHHFQDELGMNLKVRYETDCKVICNFPERRLFNTQVAAYEFIRLPTRQFKRGICKDNCRIVSPVLCLWENDSRYPDFSYLKYALNSWYPNDCEQAIKELKDARVSVALSPKFMLSRSVTYQKGVFHLWYMNKLIGLVDKDVVKVKHPLFKQEILDNASLFKPFSLEF